MSWVKNNPSLAAGIFLPLLLMAMFAAAAMIPRLLVDPPKHDLVFYLDSYQQKLDVEVRLNVADGKLKAEYRKKREQYNNQNPEIYYYSAATDSTRKISVLPPAGAPEEWQEFPIGEVANLTLDANQLAPDGYKINEGGYHSGDLGLFGPRYSSYGFRISKEGRAVMINPTREAYYGNTHFLGWVVSK